MMIYMHCYGCRICSEDYRATHKDETVYVDECPFCNCKDNEPYDILEFPGEAE